MKTEKCTKCGAEFESGREQTESLFGTISTPVLCDECYAAEARKGFVGPIDRYLGEKVEDCILLAGTAQNKVFAEAEKIVAELRAVAMEDSLLAHAIAREDAWEEIAEAAEEEFPAQASRLKSLAAQWTN